METTEERVENPQNVLLKLAYHEEKLDKHDKDIKSHEDQLEIHSEQIKQLQNNALKLENIVMSENRETRQTIVNTNNQLHSLIKDLMGYKTTDKVNDNELKRSQWEFVVKIVGTLAGSGGILYYILSNVFN